jgi:hypothetical protein
MSDDQTPQDPAVEDSPMPEETTPVEAVQPQTFPADYVQELRQEAADYRTRSKSMATQLVQAWAAVDGRLLDPTDLPLSSVDVAEDGTISRDAVTAAIDALVKSKPHLAAQRPAPMPQGAQPGSEPVSLLRILQNRP